MPAYKLTLKADRDVTEAYLYSYANFGEAQPDAYFSDLTACFQLLAEQPRLGRIQPGKTENSRTFFHRSHIIAYRITAAGILVQRVFDGRREWQRLLRRD